MAQDISFEIKVDNVDKVTDELEKAVERALEIIGGKAETYAKQNCPVDTGLLKNSITHAVGGYSTSTKKYHADTGDKSGEYNGTAGKKGDNTVYIGSNVTYAAYNEFHHKKKAHFLRKAVENHIDEYKSVISGELSK